MNESELRTKLGILCMQGGFEWLEIREEVGNGLMGMLKRVKTRPLLVPFSDRMVHIWRTLRLSGLDDEAGGSGRMIQIWWSLWLSGLDDEAGGSDQIGWSKYGGVSGFLGWMMRLEGRVEP